jgi:fused signal recognition particle receptor
MGLFSKFKKGLSKGSELLQGAIDRVSGRGSLSEDDLFNLEEAFYSCDFGPETTEDILSQVQLAHRNNKDLRGEDVRQIARTVWLKCYRARRAGSKLPQRNPRLSV